MADPMTARAREAGEGSMRGAFRLSQGGRVDRAKPIRFTFDGKAYTGCAGDTLASALLANGVHLMGRSFKYHRPRGVLSLGSDEPNALVAVDAGKGRVTPNLRATQIELYDGLRAHEPERLALAGMGRAGGQQRVRAVHSRRLLLQDLHAAERRLGERSTSRRSAAPRVLAKRRASPTPTTTRSNTPIATSRWSARVPPAWRPRWRRVAQARGLWCSTNRPEFGGSLLAERNATIDGAAAADWLAAALAELAAAPRVRLLPRTQIFGYYAQNFLAGQQRLTDHLANPDPRLPRERLWQVRAKEVVLATGAHERPLVFPNNDRPGVMLADAARTLVTRYGVKPGVRIVVATAHDSAYRAALDLAAAGCEIAMIADLRAEAQGPLPQAARRAGLRVETSAAIVGRDGGLRVTHALVAKRWSDGTPGKGEPIACDLIAMSGGWTPNVNLYSQSRGKVVFDEGMQNFLRSRRRRGPPCR